MQLTRRVGEARAQVREGAARHREAEVGADHGDLVLDVRLRGVADGGGVDGVVFRQRPVGRARLNDAARYGERVAAKRQRQRLGAFVVGVRRDAQRGVPPSHQVSVRAAPVGEPVVGVQGLGQRREVGSRGRGPVTAAQYHLHERVRARVGVLHRGAHLRVQRPQLEHDVLAAAFLGEDQARLVEAGHPQVAVEQEHLDLCGIGGVVVRYRSERGGERAVHARGARYPERAEAAVEGADRE